MFNLARATRARSSRDAPRCRFADLGYAQSGMPLSLPRGPIDRLPLLAPLPLHHRASSRRSLRAQLARPLAPRRPRLAPIHPPGPRRR